MLIAFGRASTSLIALAHCHTVFLRRDAAPRRIVFAGEKFALTFRFATRVTYAALYVASFAVELFAANYALQHSARLAVWPGARPRPLHVYLSTFGFAARLGQATFDMVLTPIELSATHETIKRRSIFPIRPWSIPAFRFPAQLGSIAEAPVKLCAAHDAVKCSTVFNHGVTRSVICV